MYDYHVCMVQDSNARLHCMVTVIVGKHAHFHFSFKAKMLKCVFCALLYTYIIINTDD